MDDGQLTRYFEQALARTGDARREFLESLDSEQRQQIEQLLQADQSAEDRGLFQPVIGGVGHSRLPMDSASNSAVTPALHASAPRAIPPQIGGYKILELIGEGGMGSVFMAEQTQPVKRRVALKVIKAGMDTDQIIARFEAERQAMAMMDHAHIAKVFDMGVTGDGLPYFVMELVHGVAITKYCDEVKLTPKERLLLFIKVCRAIQHAHQKGIIHRDIKPSNILVTQADGKPVPKIIDFGLAKALQPEKLTEKTLFTNFGQVLGTLEYMSPEQAELNSRNVDTRSDVYSLGVLLYELLTGSTPIGRERMRTEGFQRIIERIREEEPQRPSLKLSDSGDAIIGISAQRATEPSRLSGVISGDLDWIAMKSLEKDRGRRYDGPGTLADEIERYLSDEPINARPPSLSYRLKKTYHRHRLVVVAVMSLMLTLVTGLIGTGTMWLRARSAESVATKETENTQQALKRVWQERDRANEARADTEEALTQSKFALAMARYEANRFAEAIDYLDQIPREDRELEWRLLRRQVEGNDAWLVGHTAAVTGISWSMDGDSLATSSNDGTIKIWDVNTGLLQRTLAGHTGAVKCLAFSPTGDQLASGGEDQTIRLWDVGATQEARILTKLHAAVESVAYDIAGKRLVAGSEPYRVTVWNVETGSEINLPQPLPGGLNPVFSPSGKEIAIARFDGIRLINAETGQEKHSLYAPPNKKPMLRYSPDGKSVAWPFDNRGFVQRIANSMKCTADQMLDLQTTGVHAGAVHDIAFSPDSLLIATSSNQSVRLWTRGSVVGWEPKTSPSPVRVIPTLDVPHALSFSPNTRHIVWICGNAVRMIRLSTTRPEIVVSGVPRLVAMAVNSGATTVAVAGTSPYPIYVKEIGDRKSPLRILRSDSPATCLAFSPDETMLVSGSRDGTIRLWDVETGDVTREITDSRGPIKSVAFLDGGRTIAAVCNSGILLRAAMDGQLKFMIGGDGPHDMAAFSHDKIRVLTCGEEGLQLWNLVTHKIEKEYGRRPRHFVFSADDKRIGLITAGRALTVLELDGRELFPSVPVDHDVLDLSFNAKGTRLITAGNDTTVGVWDAAEGQRLTAFKGHGRLVSSVSMVPQPESILSASADGTVRRWSAAEPRFVLLTRHTRDVDEVSFSEDGASVHSRSGEEVRRCDLETRQQISPGDWPGTSTNSHPNGRWRIAHFGDRVYLTDSAARTLTGAPATASRASRSDHLRKRTEAKSDNAKGRTKQR